MDLDDLELADIARERFPGDELAQRQWIMDHRRGQLEDALEGDGGGFAAAIPWLSAVAPLIQQGTSAASNAIQKSEREKKAMREQEAYRKSHGDELNAQSVAKSSRAAAAQLAAEAAVAKSQAQSEADPRGPLHQAAERAAKLAAMMATSAATAEAKLAVYQPPKPSPEEHRPRPWYERLPSWAPYAAGGAFALVVAAGVFYALRRK